MSNNERQMHAAHELEIAPDPSYEIVKFTVEEIGDALYVTRAYRPMHAPSLRYFECYSVGPRGGVTLRGKTFSY